MQETLAVEAAARGIALTPAQLAQFETYYHELIEWNSRFNLTRITDYTAVSVQHFLDSLMPLALCSAAFPEGGRVVDVGSGAGLPGVALKIARPDLRLTLTDAVGKKVRFLDHLIERLGLAETTAVHARAEDMGRDSAYRGAFDVAVARAVADMAVLAEYLLPLVRVGGVVIAQKGSRAEDEVDQARAAISTLGGAAARLAEYTLPGLDAPRSLVIITKARKTPDAYPRRAGVPSQAPL
ncbi:MAG: 16S rRNA (guanine(527)-N(7))-methyltransferase RsmG [Anaerolineae bacterium]